MKTYCTAQGTLSGNLKGKEIQKRMDVCTDMGLPKWLSGEESACQCRRHKRLRFNSWDRKTPWSRK